MAGGEGTSVRSEGFWTVVVNRAGHGYKFHVDEDEIIFDLGDGWWFCIWREEGIYEVCHIDFYPLYVGPDIGLAARAAECRRGDFFEAEALFEGRTRLAVGEPRRWDDGF